VSDLSLDEHQKQDSTFKCRDGVIHTESVHSYEPNDYGLYNMLGNVQEFTCSGFSEARQKRKALVTFKKNMNTLLLKALLGIIRQYLTVLHFAAHCQEI
jgi:hypothetical protein